MGTRTDLLERWRLNNAINLRLIDAISDAGMTSTMSTRGGRDVARQFVHLHDVRWAWLSIAHRLGERHQEDEHEDPADQGAAQDCAHGIWMMWHNKKV